jgi:hypothetical protein
VEVTRQGRAVGTPRYIAPEQAKGLEVGPWSDLYALGLLFYELLTARQAVQPDDVEGALQMHVDPEPLPMPGIDEMPRGCAQLIRRLTAQDANNRYRDGGHLASDIDAYLGERRGESKNRQTDEIRSTRRQSNQSPPGRRVTRWSWMRPVNGWQWFESLVAGVTVLATFIVVTAHFPETSFGLRVAIGFAPTVLAVTGALSTTGTQWRLGPIRRMNLYSLIAFVAAHAFLDERWFLEMTSSAAWFLEPIDHLPGVETVAVVLQQAAAWWGRLWV